MTVTVEIPDEIAAAIEQRGQTVPEYLLRSAQQALGSPAAVGSEERHAAVEAMFAARRNLHGKVSLEEILAWKEEGRR